MKLSIVLSTQPASFSALAYKGRMEENLRTIQSLGYDGVELAVRDPKLLDLEELDGLLKDNRLPVPAIGTGQAFGEEGLSFTHPDESIRRQAVDRIKAQMDLGAHLDAIVIIGLIRGQRYADTSMQTMEARFAEALKECADYRPDIGLAIEPINRYETDLLCTVEDALRFIDTLSLENVGLLLDTFHMNIEEPDPLTSIVAARERLFHFHVADSNRWHPGAGHIDFGRIVETLETTGYDGYVSAEILPHPDPDTASRKTMETMRVALDESKERI